ncbi:MAG: helix-turn-helix domain-containing protein [Thermaurantiacus sp.]
MLDPLAGPLQSTNFSIMRHRYPTGDYAYPASGMVLLWLVRRGSSHANIDLGFGERGLFTRPGDMMLSLPERATRYRIVEAREISMLFLEPAIALSWLNDCGGETLEDLAPLSRRPARSPLIARLFDRLEAQPRVPPAVQQALGVVIIAECLRLTRAARAADRRGVVSRGAIDRLIQTVDETLERPVCADALASGLGVSRRTFSATFKEATGLPFHQYVLRMRVDRAVHLLTTTDLSLAVIAMRCGFAHQAHMSRMVSRLKGQAPGVIRRQAAGR